MSRAFLPRDSPRGMTVPMMEHWDLQRVMMRPEDRTMGCHGSHVTGPTQHPVEHCRVTYTGPRFVWELSPARWLLTPALYPDGPGL